MTDNEISDDQITRFLFKNEFGWKDGMREMILTTVKNQVKFKYVLMDTWFGAKENFEFITKHKKEFIFAIKK